MTQDNPHLGKRSTTTGEPGPAMDQAWKASVVKPMPAHRTIVLSENGYLFPVHCRTCHLLEPPRKGMTKKELQAFAREHEESNGA